MTSPAGKSEKASSSFWKKSPVAAFPGRPNLQARPAVSNRSSVAPSASAAAGAGSTTTASFRDFEASVSDAWNASADDLLPATHR